ncbi:MAG: putative sugar nucleotidyl transferase, partial [Gemmatimonadota bacterium]
MPESPLYLLEPADPGPEWSPFAGVRPIAELRAGIWRIRERWEGALRMDAKAIVGGQAEGFQEGDEPVCRLLGPIEGPAVVALSTFAPSGLAPEVAPGTRRLVSEGQTAAWIVAAGETWSEPHDDGVAAPIDGHWLRAAHDLLTVTERFLLPDCSDFLASGDQDPIRDGSIILGDPGYVISRGALIEPGVVFDVRHGPVILEAGVEVRNGTRLEGPLYAGTSTRLLGGFIRTSVFGPWCVARGEIAASIFTGFANKGHDGFV